MKKHRHCALKCILFASWMMGFCLPGTAVAQNTELTSSDNHALLYAHQLGFSSSGAPTVRMRIADELQKLRFVPEDEFVVVPSGSGGVSIRLKGHQVYEVTISNAEPGTYQYSAIISRNESIEALKSAEIESNQAGIATEIVPVGTVFALRGHVFDNRENLLMTKRMTSLEETERLSSQIPAHLLDGESAEIYQELMTYPTAHITLRDEKGNVQIDHQNLLWIEFAESGAKLLDIPDESGKKHDLKLNSQIIVTPDKSGHLAVVQSADIETILRGIVPSEIFASAPEAALMAQAIAARTTLIAQAGARHNSDPYHLCNKQHCQVYGGLSGADPRTDEAIKKTRGQVMFYEKSLVQSYYSSHCGGISAGSRETWGLPDKPYLVSRGDDHDEAKQTFKSDEDFMNWWLEPADDYCSTAPSGKKPFASTKHARWSVHLSNREIEDILNKSGHKLGAIQNIEVLERGESFRVTKLRITGTKGAVTVEHELAVRRILGGLKSGLFVIKLERSGNSLNGINISGAGFGHGVGLCQTGAIGMAQRGISATDILLHYFPGIHIDTLW